MTETLDRVKTYQQFIGGQWVDSASGETIAVENPADGTVVAHVPASGQADVDRAVDAAEAAFETWGLTTPQTRSLALLKIADILDENADELGRLESSQTGKPIPAAIDEMTTSSDLFRFFAGACRVPEGLAVTEYLDGHTSMVRRDPVGIVASIAPWNYPLYMAAWKLGPALATGNTVVLKPSARTPLSALRFAELVSEALPAGVLNVLLGSGAAMGDMLVSHPKVRMVSITGDTSTGKHIAGCRRTVKRLHLELGGKAPVIVFDDADIELAAETLKSASYWNAGQDCTAACRVIVGLGRVRQLRGRAHGPGQVDQVGQPGRQRRPRHGLAHRPGAGRQGRGHGQPGDRGQGRAVIGGTRPDRPGATTSRRSSPTRTSRPRSSRTRCSARS